MKKLIKNNKDYLIINNENIEVVFSTAQLDRSFNRNTEEGLAYLNNICKEFKVDNVQFLYQTHSDNVFIFDKQPNFNENKGDSIITNIKNVAIGVFTADCVSVILVDKTKNVVGAIHSGWKGTYDCITSKTIIKMIDLYGCNIDDIEVYIGPHIKKCCYEVSSELREKFSTKFKDEKILFENNLSLDECIKIDIKNIGILQKNILDLDLCTFCSEDLKLHSYRKSEGSYGRMFSFVIIR